MIYLPVEAPMPIDIDEIVGRADQGVTRPFLCRCGDGNVYFVKGVGAGRRSQIAELLVGELAFRFGLPIAPFSAVRVPSALIGSGARDDLGELGAGIAFGSRRVPATELSLARVSEVNEELAARVYAFDWWIQNADRTLTGNGGNPNLLWDVEAQSLVVIDHNQAFDREFNAVEFASGHVFSGEGSSALDNWVLRQEISDRFQSLLADVPLIWSAMPSEWFFVDEEQTVAADLTLGEVLIVLNRCSNADFWEGI